MGQRTFVPGAGRSGTLSRCRVLVGALFAAAVGLALLLLPGPIAHAQDNSLNEIIPANGAALLEAPTEIVLGFNQPIDNDHSVTLTVTCNGQLLLFGDGTFNDEETSVAFPIISQVPRGDCIVDWTLLNPDDAEVIADGRTTFSVDADPVGTTAPSSSTTTSTTVLSQDADTSSPVADSAGDDTGGSGAIWFGRLISTIGIMITFGALVVISTGWPEGPEYLVTLNFFRLVWIISLIGTAIYVVAYAADYADAGFAGGFNPLAWIDLVNDGLPGMGAVLRLAAVIATGYVALHPERVIDPATAMWAWLIPGAALVSLALTRVSGPLALIGVVVVIVHVAAAAAWLGGSALVARVVLAGPGEEDLVVATKTFARYSVAAIGLAVITGVIEMVRLVGASLFSTGHGRVLLLKIVAVGAMLFVGMAARQQVGQRLSREHEMSVNNADRFRRAFGAEAAIGVVVLAFSGWMLSLDAGDSVPWSDEPYAREIPFAVAALDLDATVQVGPATVGQNGFLVQVESPPEGITQLTLRFIPPTGTQNGEAWIVEQDIPLAGAGSVWRSVDDGIPLSVPGTWRLELSATTAAGVEPGALMTFRVDNADGSEADPTPTEAPVDTTPTNTQVIEQTPVTADIATTTTSSPAATDPSTAP